MNNYPSWWDQTITVYNKYEDPETRVITWYKTVLTDCFWKYSDESILVGSTRIETNQTICRVPINDAFLEKYLWEQLSETDKASHFTFGPGDIIIKGEASDIVNEYVSGQRSSDLVTKYKKLQGCMIVDYCIVNTGGGRGNEHYRIKGI